MVESVKRSAVGISRPTVLPAAKTFGSFLVADFAVIQLSVVASQALQQKHLHLFKPVQPFSQVLTKPARPLMLPNRIISLCRKAPTFASP